MVRGLLLADVATAQIPPANPPPPPSDDQGLYPILKANQGPLYQANSLPLDDIDRGVMSDLKLQLDKPTSRDPTSLAAAPKDPGTHITLPNNVASAVGLTPEQYNTWSNYLIKRESSGNYGLPPNKKGFMGLYQMGPEEISEAAKRVGIPVPSQEDFLANKDHVQDRLFENYTLQHHQELMKNPTYANAAPQQKAAILMGAHLGGVDGVQKYLASGGKYNPDDDNGHGTHISDYVNGTLAAMNGDPIGGIGSAGSLETFQQSQQQAQQLAAQEQQRLDTVLKQLGSSKGDTQERRRLLQDSLDRSRALQDQMLQLAQNPPTKKPTDLLSTFGSLAMLIGAIGGLKSRQPATAALQAAAGVIEGVNTNNDQEFDRNLKVWQSQSKLLSELTGIQAQDFRTIMENDRLDESERHNRLEETLTAYGMQDSLDKLHMGLLEEAWKGPYTVMTLDQELKKSIAQVSEINARAAKERQLAAMGGKVEQFVDTGTLDPEGHPTVYSKDAFGNTFKIEMQTDPSDGSTKQVRIPYNPVAPGKVPTTSAGTASEQQLFNDLQAARQSGDKDAIGKAEQAIKDFNETRGKGQRRSSAPAMFMQKVIEEHPEYSSSEIANAMGDYRRIQGLEGGFASGVLGRQIVSLNTVSDHLILVKEYFEALRNGQIPRANQLANVVATELGKPEVTNFRAGRDIMADEVVRLLTTTGGTESDRQGMQSRLSYFASPAQGEGVINAFNRFVAGRFEALEQQYSQNDPKRKEYFNNNLLTEKSRRIFSDSIKEGAATSLPSDLPPPTGHAEGSTAKDESGKVVAIIHGGKWVAP